MVPMFIVYIAFVICVCIVAARENRSVFGWFIAALIFSPFVAGLFLLCLGPVQNTAAPVGEKKCAACAEFIKVDAKICKHCRTPQVEPVQPELVFAAGEIDAGNRT